MVSASKKDFASATNEERNRAFENAQPMGGSVQPHVLAERALLGAVLAQPHRMAAVAALVKAENFSVPAHATLFGVLTELETGGTPIDFVTVCNGLQVRGKLDLVGGAAGVASFDTDAPSAANAEAYARNVAEAAAHRRVKQVHLEQLKAMNAGAGSAREYALDAQEALSEAVEGLQQGGFVPMVQLLDRALGHVEAARAVKGGVTGVATGFDEFDRMTTGLHPGELIVMAARPGIGKTSLAVNMAVHVGLSGAGAVGVFSLEMPAMQLALRALASVGNVALRRLREGGLNDHDMEKLNRAAFDLSKAEIFVDDTAAITLAELRARAKVLKQQSKLALLVVDYLQLMGRGGKWQGREAEVGENSRGLKQVAKELGVPVLALAQMNRKVEERTGGKPMLSDLRESGSIEADADLVMFIHPDEVEDEEKTRGRRPVSLIIAKQRNGPTGDIPLDLVSEFTRFEPRPWQSEAA